MISTTSLVVVVDADNNQQQIDITSAINTRARFECTTVSEWWEISLLTAYIYSTTGQQSCKQIRVYVLKYLPPAPSHSLPLVAFFLHRKIYAISRMNEI